MRESPFLLLAAVWICTLIVLGLTEAAGIIVLQSGMSPLVLVSIFFSIAAWGLGEVAARLMFACLPSNPSVTTSMLTGPRIRRSRANYLLISLLFLSGVGYMSFLETRGVIDLLRFSSVSEAFLALNIEIAEEMDSFGGVYGRLYVLPVIGLSLSTYLAARGELARWSAVLFALCFLVLLISPRRALLLQGSLVAVLVYLEARRGRWLPMPLVSTIFVALIVFVATQVLLAKTDATLHGLLSPIGIYIAANIPAMDELLLTSHFNDTHVLLNVPLRIANQVFGYRFPTELDVPFVFVGAYSNTVPFQYYLLKDGGLLGLVLATMILGFVAFIACRVARLSGTFGAIWLKSAILVFIIFSFREFTLITYNWVFFLFTALLVSLLIHSPGPKYRSADAA